MHSCQVKRRQPLLFVLGLLWSVCSPWTVVVVSAQDSGCPLVCLNGSTCKEGEASYLGHPLSEEGNALEMHHDTNVDGYHCECLEGFTGVTCGHRFESCADQDTGHACYHGGTCVPGGTDDYGNPQYHCDCSQAIQDGNSYSGKYCEVVDIDICNSDKTKFCLNGSCQPSNVNDDSLPFCSCQTGWDGPHCEFRLHEVPLSCSLICQNGGSCQIGLRSYDEAKRYDYWKINSDGSYCDCPAHFQGAQCQTEAVTCGENKCFNGATCVQVTKQQPGDPDEYFCDCTTASNEVTSYSGQFCQFEATTYCTKNPTQNGHVFCVNGGTCIDQGNGLYSCECPAGFHGPNCEFRYDDLPAPEVEKQEEYMKCDLTCFNGGECRKGAKDLSGSHTDITQDQEKHNDDFEHCVCPAGYIGLQCQTKVEQCGDGVDENGEPEHVCLHGSKCKMDPASGNWGCQCETAFTPEKRLAGDHCQHHHTDICTQNRAFGVYEGPTSYAFCVNDGVCAERVVNGESHPGCHCPEEYTGVHCELLQRTINDGRVNDSTTTDYSVGRDPPLLFTIAVLVIVLVVLSFVIAVRLRQRSLRQEAMLHNAYMEEDGDEKDIIDQIEFKEKAEELEDVELI